MAIPTPMSKVIPVNLDFKSSSISNWKPFNTGMGFWTNDIGTAFLEFSTGLDLTGTVASIVLENQYDKSLVQKTITEITSSPFYYQLGDEIQHEGRWFVQISVKKGEETIVSNSFAFMVNASIGHGKVARLVSIETFETLATQLTALQTAINNYLETAETSEAIRILTYDEVILAEETRKEEEDIRKANDITRGATASSDHNRANTDHSTATTDHSTAVTDHGIAQTDHSTAVTDHGIAQTDHSTAVTDHGIAQTDHSTAVTDHTSYEGLLTDGVLATNIENKLLYLETTYAPELNSVKQQLAETIRIDESNLSLNNFNEHDRAVIQGLAEGEINAVLGLGNVGRENIADKAVTPEKTSFIDATNLFISNEVEVGKTIGTNGQVENDSARWLGGYIPVSSGETLSIFPASYRIQYYNKSRSPVGTRSGSSGGTITVVPDGIIRYIRLSGVNSNSYDKIMLNRGSTLLPFRPYGILKKEHLPEDEGLLLGEVETENIAENAITPEKTSFIDTTNLFNPNSVQVGKTIGTNSQVEDDPMRWLGGYISVSAGEILSISPGSYRIQYYNKSRSPVGTRSGSSGGTITVAPEGSIRYIRLSGVNSNSYDKIMLNRGGELLPFRPYGIMKKEHLPEDKGILLGEVEPKHTNFFHIPNNLFNLNTLLIGKSVDVDGSVIDDPIRWLSDFIEVGYGNDVLSITKDSYRIGRYDKNFNFLNRGGITGSSLINLSISASAPTKYIRISGAINPEIVMLNRGSTLLPWESGAVVLKKQYMPSDLQIDTDQIVAQVREEMKGQLTQYQPSFPKLTFETVTTGWSIPKWMSADGEVIYGDYGGELLQSFDEWETRTRIGNAPLVSSIAGVRELGDGELLVSTHRDESINLKSKVFKTVGYDRNNPGATTFKEVLEADSVQANINNWWGFSVYENIVTISDYGLKGAEGGKNVWVSTDYGETFTMIFNQHLIGQQVEGAPPYTATAHMHTAAYDPYFNRIWVVVGDNPNTATYYSDDMGTSWTFVEGSTVVQYTGIIALPNAVLFGSDRNPNGVHVYHRGNKSDMPVIKPLLLVNDSKVITHVFQMPFKRDWHPTTPVYFASEGISASGGRAVIIGTVDGKTANLMFEADLSGPYSGNMHSPLGPTAQGNIVSYMEDSSISGYRTVKAKAPTWSRV